MKKRDFIYLTIIVWIGLLMLGRCNSDADKVDQKDQIIAEKEAKIKEVRLKNGKTASDKLRVEADLKSLKEGYGFLEDSLKHMGIKAKHLKSALFLAQHTRGSGKGKIDTVNIIRNDTVIIAREMSIEEKYFRFNATIFPHGDFDYYYSFTDSLAIINITTRKNIFSKRVHSVRVVNSNPNMKLSGITSLTITEKGHKYHIGPVLMLSYDKGRVRPAFGVGVVYSLISF